MDRKMNKVPSDKKLEFPMPHFKWEFGGFFCCMFGAFGGPFEPRLQSFALGLKGQI
jgi:hypothetical protein